MPHGAPMIGRELPLTALREAVAEGRSGQPAVVLVAGEAGMGKTRLISEFLDELEADSGPGDVLVLRGACSSADRSEVPWGPFLDVLRDLRRSLGTEAFLELAGGRATELSLLDPGIPVEAPPVGPDRGRLMRVVSGLLLDAATVRPTLLVIEDVQWADEGSRRVLEYVVRSLRREPLTVVLTVRLEETPNRTPGIVQELLRTGVASRLQLSRLDRGQIAQQLSDLCGAAPDPGVLDQTEALSAGVPLYVEEVAAALQSNGDLTQMSGRLHGHRLDGLQPDALQVVQAAAVAVTPPSAVNLLVASALPGEAFDAALTDALDAGVLSRRGHLIEFRHAVLREATLDRMLPHRERELHVRWADVLEPGAEELESAVTVARHRIIAAEPSAALVSCVRAADVAGRASGFSVQLDMLLEAARLWPVVESPEELVGRDLADVLGQAAEASFFASMDTSECLRLARRAGGLLGADSPPARRAWLDLLVLRCRYSQAEQIPVEELLAVVTHIPRDPPTRERVVACVTAANQLLQAGRTGDAELYALEGAGAARVLGLVQLEADAVSTEAQLRLHRGEYGAAVSSAVRARQLADATGDPLTRADALQILSVVLWNGGELASAVETGRLAVELLGGQRPGPNPAQWAMNLTNLAEGLIELGEWTEAQHALDLVLEGSQQRSRATDFAGRLSRHLRLWRDGPDPAYVVGGLPTDPDATLETVALQDLVPARYTDADIGSQHRDLARTRAELRTILADERTVQLPEPLYDLLGVAARTEADAKEEGWPDPDPGAGTWTMGQVEWLLGLMTPAGSGQEAHDAHIRADLARWADQDDVSTWAHVVALWRRTSQPRPLALALTRLGSVAVASGDRSRARQALSEALQISERLGARPISTSVHEVARDHALRLGTSASSRESATTSLTPRELEVLRLLAEGASNVEIGGQLFISPRTASVHVSHILEKLGVGSRTAAATVAHKAGLLTEAAVRDD